jgi:hypothetical protein
MRFELNRDVLTTVFKDKIPKGMSYPFPLEFLKHALRAASDQAVAVYFVHGSLWVLGKHNLSKEHFLRMPREVLSAGRVRPFLRNNNQKVPVDVEDNDWHFLIWAVPCESRHVLQKEFEDTAAKSLTHWLVAGKTRSSGAKVWWNSETRT